MHSRKICSGAFVHHRRWDYKSLRHRWKEKLGGKTAFLKAFDAVHTKCWPLPAGTKHWLTKLKRVFGLIDSCRVKFALFYCLSLTFPLIFLKELQCKIWNRHALRRARKQGTFWEILKQDGRNLKPRQDKIATCHKPLFYAWYTDKFIHWCVGMFYIIIWTWSITSLHKFPNFPHSQIKMSRKVNSFL